MFDIELMRRASAAAAMSATEARDARAYREPQDAAFEASEPETPIPNLSDADIVALVSDDAKRLVIDFEVTGRDHYERHLVTPEWPGGDSGITIGIGYDVGYHTEAELQAHWSGIIPDQDILTLKAAVGKKAQAAKAILANFRDVRIPWDAALAVFERATMPKYGRQVLRAFPNSERLQGHCFGALFSLVFNRGDSLSGERRREMAAIREHAKKQVFEPIPTEIRSMKRLWNGTNLTGLVRRREVEAILFERGLELRKVAALAPTSAIVKEGLGADESAFDGDGLYFDDSVDGGLSHEAAGGDVAWPASDSNAPDYAHLLETDRALSGKAFEFGAAELELLIAANSFQPSRDLGRIVFALRGVELVTSLTSPKTVLSQIDQPMLLLKDTRPNHRDLRCLIGVYDLTTGRLSGFAASTVPNVKAVTAYFTNQSSGNMTPTGCYRFEVGWHMVSKPERRVPGCLVERGRRKAVVRSVNDMTYALDDPWQNERDTGNNLHPAFGGATQKFSSFGCLVVNGSYTPTSPDRVTGVHEGQWGDFRRALGLTAAGTGDHGKEYDVVLLTGLEALIARDAVKQGQGLGSPAVIERLARLRQGSRGDKVKALQQFLKLPETGIMDHATTKAFVDFQKADQAGKSSGVFAPALDAKFKLGILAPAEPVKVALGGSGGIAHESALGEEPNPRLEKLYYEIGLAAEMARRNPGASGVSLESLAAAPTMERISVDLGFAGLKSIGLGIAQQLERQLQQAICGGALDQQVDRDAIRGKVDQAATQGVGALRGALSEVLSKLSYLPRSVTDQVVDILIERFVKPVTGGFGQKVSDRMDLTAAWLCTQWQADLARRGIAPPPTAQSATPAAATQPAAPATAAKVPITLVDPSPAAAPQPSSRKVPAMLDQIERAAKADRPDAAAVRHFIRALRTYVDRGVEELTPPESSRLLAILCDTRFMEQLAGAVGPDPYALMKEIEDITGAQPVDRQRLKDRTQDLVSLLADARLDLQPEPIKRLLRAMRSVKAFDELSLLADRLIARNSQIFGFVWTLYAQGLIDTGRIAAGIEVLQTALNGGRLTPDEVEEATGLLGRAGKQKYVNHIKTPSDAAALGSTFGPVLVNAAECYGKCYDPEKPGEKNWHGINYIALLKRAERDGIKMPQAPKADDLARAMVKALEPKVAQTNDSWELATIAEANLALGNYQKAAEYYGRYAQHPEVSAFQLGGSVRQLEEVWQLKAGDSGASAILLGLKGALARKDGGAVSLAYDERKTLEKVSDVAFQEYFETTVDGGKFINIYILKQIVRCGAAIAAIQQPMGQSARTLGTGFLVRGPDFGQPDDGSYLLTNAHVMWDPTMGDGHENMALTPDAAQIIFENDLLDGRQEKYRASVVWQSPSSVHDAVLLKLDRKITHIEPLKITASNDRLVPSDTNGSKLAVLGYPKGGNLAVGVLGDLGEAQGTLVDRGGKGASQEPVFFHYRTPTEPGNSGSPVFEIESWQVVALHHAGFRDQGLPRLGGKPGSTQANEGICIHSIRAAVKAAAKPEKKGRWSWRQSDPAKT